MKVNRRSFLKGTAGLAGGGALASFLSSGPKTLVAGAVEGAEAGKEEWVPTTCWIGKQDCGMLARKINGRVVKFEGHPANPRNRGKLCPKGIAQIMAVYDPNRVKTPLIRTNAKGGPGKWRQASWDEALDLVAAKIKDVRKRDKRLLVWQKGRSKAKKFYDTAFVKASGATKLHHGAYCSDAGLPRGRVHHRPPRRDAPRLPPLPLPPLLGLERHRRRGEQDLLAHLAAAAQPGEGAGPEDG
ncbi:MAG: molybdopterin-dependent oxidoreductase, partial [bacterium]